MTIGPEQAVATHMRDKRRAGLIWLAMALVLMISLGATYRTDKQLTNSSSQVEALRGQAAANGQIAQSAKEAAEEANRRLAAAGKPTVPVPTESPISPTAEPVERVTEAEVRSIVSAEVRAYSPTLTPSQVEQIARVTAPKVPRPKDGTTPTPETLRPLVVTAVASYCTEDRCVGRPGKDGRDAPPVSDERLSAMIDQSLAAYCAKQPGGSCEGQPGKPGADSTVPGPVGPAGPVGPTGPPGATGEQGRSVVDTDCMDDGRWRITYDKPFPDGEVVRYSRGPCRAVVLPPTPTSEAKGR